MHAHHELCPVVPGPQVPGREALLQDQARFGSVAVQVARRVPPVDCEPGDEHPIGTQRTSHGGDYPPLGARSDVDENVAGADHGVERLALVQQISFS